jgi:hypothetical protein
MAILLGRIAPVLLAAATALIFLSGCAAAEESSGEVTGVVTEVTGDLTSAESFVVIDVSGDSFKFVPGEGMTVAGGPVSHLRDHVVSGEPVKVLFHAGSKGELIADDIQDAG